MIYCKMQNEFKYIPKLNKKSETLAKKNKQRKSTIICLIDRVDFNFEFIKII